MGKNYTVHAIIDILSPLHIATPGERHVKLGEHYVRLGRPPKGADGAFPCTATQRYPYNSPATGYREEVPMIAANNLMGHLRRKAKDIVLAEIGARGERINVMPYNALTCGAPTGKPDTRDLSFPEYREVRRHPYLGLLGGGPSMARRRVICHDGIPYYGETAHLFEKRLHPELESSLTGDAIHCVAHSRPARNGEDENGGRAILTQVAMFRRNDDLLMLADIDTAAASIENFEEVMTQRQAAILKSGSDHKEGAAAEKGTKLTTRAYSGLEFVIPGTKFPVMWELCGVDDAQLGLFLLALDRFAQCDRLGGWTRNGLGRFSLRNVLLVSDGSAPESIFDNGRLIKTGATAGFLGAWSEAAANITGADLNRLLNPAAKPAKKDKGGEGAAA